MKRRLRNIFSNLRDDLDFLARKDVSFRFKILNILSGDRLRPAIAFTLLDLDKVKAITGLNELTIDKVRYDLNDIWRI